VLLFGGVGSPSEGGDFGLLSDTWSWNGATWTELSPARSPEPGIGSSMAYDPATEVMLLFDDGYGGDNKTWTFRDRMP
jgi:hypothetical protein